MSDFDFQHQDTKARDEEKVRERAAKALDTRVRWAASHGRAVTEAYREAEVFGREGTGQTEWRNV